MLESYISSIKLKTIESDTGKLLINFLDSGTYIISIIKDNNKASAYTKLLALCIKFGTRCRTDLYQRGLRGSWKESIIVENCKVLYRY